MIGGITHDLLGIVRDRKQRGGVDVIGVSTGFHVLDKWTGGLQPDTLTLIGAATSMGKSAFALNLAYNMAQQGDPILYVSLEMGNGAIGMRMLSMITGIEKYKIQSGRLSDAEFRSVVEASEQLNEIPLLISARSYSSQKLCEEAIEYSNDVEPLKGVFIDYLGLLVDGGQHGEHERITKVSSRLRNLARPEQLNAPVVTLVQLTKAVEQRDDKRPNIGDIRDSGSPAQDAENVWLLFRPAHYERMKGPTPAIEDDAEIIVAKNREGMVGTMKAQYIPARTQWLQPRPVPVAARREPTPIRTSA